MPTNKIANEFNTYISEIDLSIYYSCLADPHFTQQPFTKKLVYGILEARKAVGLDDFTVKAMKALPSYKAETSH